MIKWGIGIVQRDGYVLIGKLRKENPMIPRMKWTFPLIKIKDDESPRTAIKTLFNEHLGLKVSIEKFLLKYVPSENTKVEQYYYELKRTAGNVISSKDYAEFCWIKPTQVLKFFTTAISKELMDYLRTLEKTGKGLIIN